MAREEEASASRKKFRFAPLLSEEEEEEEEEMVIEEVEIGDRDSECHSEDDEVDGEDEEYMEEDDDEDLGSDSVHEHEEGSDEQASVAVAAAVPVALTTAVANVTVCDVDALECGVCFQTLRPPIFQCEVGHVVCSACRDKLEATGNGSGNKCHVCGVATRGFRRCHAMEQLVDCIRVPCPYAAHGCDATPPYHGQESHRQVCPHAPCHCPGDGESCGFLGSTSALLDHFAGAHIWPCTTKVRPGETFSISLHLGFNFILLADQDRDDDGEQASATGGVPCRLFLLNVTQERLGRAISVLCISIHPHANSADQPLSTQCELVFSSYGDRSLCRSHYQLSVFKVVCTDLSNGLPDPEGCFQFLVPNAVLGDGDDKNSILVKVRIVN